MENQTNLGDQNIQQMNQNPVDQPIQVTEKLKVNYRGISISVLLTVLLLGVVWFVFNTKKRTVSDKQQTISNQANQTTVTGVIRTVGLGEEEKQKLGLELIQFQITDFITSTTISGYYLQFDNNEIEGLLGKCVEISGEIPDEWKNRDVGGFDNIPYTYARVALIPKNIKQVDYTNCNPYTGTPSTDAQEKLILKGTIVHGKRPSPDIGYDYQLHLVEPFVDKENSSGSPQTVSLVDAIPSTNSIWKELENNLNKEIIVEGYMVWGYAESKYLEIISVKNVSGYDQAINILEAIPEIQIIKQSVINNGRKIFYTPEEEIGNLVRVSIREEGFDDAHTSRIDTFNVNIETNAVTIEDVAMTSGQEFITLDVWKKSINERFK